MGLFLLIICAAALLGVSAIVIFLGSYLLGRPLSKGCGKSDCCQKTSQNTYTQADSKTKTPHHDDTHSP